MKQCNSIHPSENRIVLSATGLNTTLDQQKEMRKLAIQKKDRVEKCVAGTDKDIQTLYQKFCSVLGSPKSSIKLQKRNCNAFYKENPDLKIPPPSNKAEEAFNSVGNWFVKHQDMLLKSAEVVDNELQEEEEEGEGNFDVEYDSD